MMTRWVADVDDEGTYHTVRAAVAANTVPRLSAYPPCVTMPPIPRVSERTAVGLPHETMQPEPAHDQQRKRLWEIEYADRG